MEQFPVPIEQFPALSAIRGIAHGFVTRIPGLETKGDKAAVLAQLAPLHAAAVTSLGFQEDRLWTAGQVHGAAVADVPAVTDDGSRRISGVDGLITARRGVLLGIHVADCAPVYLFDPVRRVIGLLHSGRRGSEQHIVTNALELMAAEHGSIASDVVVQIGPCIRPPQYEVDFAAIIRSDAASAGVLPGNLHDCMTCTASEPERYYSYRRELGHTGRLLALLGMT